MSARWQSPELPPVNRDAGGSPRRPADRPSTGRRFTRAVLEALVIAAVVVGLLAVLVIAIKTTP
jgi:hypothetical protein